MHSKMPERVSGSDLDLLVKHQGMDATSSSGDPLCSFLIGALVWWHLVDSSQCVNRFGITDSSKCSILYSAKDLLLLIH
jgi:hypothetical protein